jgi:hypothetical protein
MHIGMAAGDNVPIRSMLNMSLRYLSFWAALTWTAGLCLAGDSSMDRATLRGLKAVKVVVDSPGPEIERAGVDREFLRTGLEQKLRDAGIKIDNDVNEFLGVSISSARGGRRGPISLVVGLGVYQVVTLSRDKEMKTVAETWGDQRVVSATARGLDRSLLSVVDELADEFVRAYRSVNPQ